MTAALHAFLLTPRSAGPQDIRQREGKYLRFQVARFQVAHETAYAVISRRGMFVVGTIEWNTQYRAYMYRPHPEATLPLSCLAEIYVFIKELGGRTV